MPADKVASATGSIIRSIIEQEGYAWRFVSHRKKELYYIEFKKQFYWDPSIEEHVKKKFLLKAGALYSDFACKKKRKRNIGKPKEFSIRAWEKWCAYWDLESTKAVSRKAQKNRLTDIDGPGSGPSIHRGGSRSATTIAQALAKERGCHIREVLYDTFKVYHCPNIVYSDPKSARLDAKVQEIYAERTQPLPDGTIPQVNINEVYIGLAFRKDKARTYGLGSLYATSSTSLSSNLTSYVPPTTSSDVVELREQLTLLQRRLDESETRNKEMIDDILRLMETSTTQ